MHPEERTKKEKEDADAEKEERATGDKGGSRLTPESTGETTAIATAARERVFFWLIMSDHK